MQAFLINNGLGGDIRCVSERIKAVSGKALYVATLSLTVFSNCLIFATPRAVLRLVRPSPPNRRRES